MAAIILNGQSQDLPRETVSVSELLQVLGAGADRVAVMVDGRIVKRDTQETTQLTDGATVEVLTLARGG